MSDVPRLTRDQSRLAERGAAIAVTLAGIYARQWRSIAAGEFLSAGHDAAVAAARAYDPAAGASFETFARIRINYAMVDHAARENYRGKGLARRMQHASAETWHEEPTVDDILDRPEPTRSDALADIRGRMAEIAASTVGNGMLVSATGDSDDALVDQLDHQRAVEKLRAAIAKLDREDQAFVRWYYEEELSVDEVAKKLGVVRRTVFRMQERVRVRLVEALGVGASP